jgi:hypothetical protein
MPKGSRPFGIAPPGERRAGLDPLLLQKGSSTSTCGRCPEPKRVFGSIGMEQLWNRGDATGGKRSARGTPENGLNYGPTVATGCHRLPFGSHGKEGVDGSSPSEGFAKFLLISSFCLPGRRRVRISASTERPPCPAIASGAASKRCCGAVLEAWVAASTQRPRHVRSRARQAARRRVRGCHGQVAVVPVDHREAGAHEP